MNPEQLLFFLSAFIFGVSLIVIWLIGQRPSARQVHEARAMTLGLWGFTPEIETTILKGNNLWNWRKLVVAGVMVSALASLITSRKFSVKTSVTISVSLLGAWILFLLAFWYLAIADSLPKDFQPQNPATVSQPASGWLSKVKLSSNADNRLPLTIITGFLGAGYTLN
jgi:hypothetical protein